MRPELLQGFEGDLEADAVAELEAVGHRLRLAEHAHGHVLDDVFLDAERDRVRGHPDDADRRVLDLRNAGVAREGEPDFVGGLARQVVEPKRREQARDAGGGLAADEGEAMMLGDAAVRETVESPADLLDDSANYRPECEGVSPKFGVWAHISGSDLVRGGDGDFYVLEDNLRVPSGVSYVIENRGVAKRTFPELFEQQRVRPVDGYTDELNKLLSSLAPDDVADPVIAVLTPGIFNSAYFEHSFLAQRMGAELVEGADLVVGDDDCVYMNTIQGLERVHVIYRRIDDLFIDPEVFFADSMLGVPGLMRAWKVGNVGIANAPGAGVADDKCVYAWVPDMIRYYLDEEPLIKNVPTYRCMYEDERAHVLANLHELVLKPANESGGYGIVIGDRATAEELETVAAAIRDDPRNWVAQPILELSTAPTLVDDGIEPRHLDLRPFVLTGEDSYVTAGGLTRVALTKGSLIVNSSQGGGSKDTWIIDGIADAAPLGRIDADVEVPSASASPPTSVGQTSQTPSPGAG